MDRYTMMSKIAKTLESGEAITISVTNARGRTLNHYYIVTNAGYKYSHHGWGCPGSLRDEYRDRVLNG